MRTEIVMPKMGESIQEGKILRWAKKVGEPIRRDETILEISTDKVDSEIPSPVGGILAEIVVAEQETVPVGTVIAYVETDANVKVQATSPPVVAPAPIATEPAAVPAEAVAAVQYRPADVQTDRFYSPLVRSIARAEGLLHSDLDRIVGTGVNGRVSKLDVLQYLQTRGGAAPFAGNASPAARRNEQPRPVQPLQERTVPMDNVQRKMAEHMVRSVHTSPHVAAIDEADMSAIVAYRNREAAVFERREGFKLTFTPFFAAAVTQALLEFPIVNSSVEGDSILYKGTVDLGIAVASPTGLIVPVVRRAHEKTFLQLARAINDVAMRTRSRKLMPDEVLGGTFSITNYGVFGNIIGTPIINQPQVAILGVGAVKKRPMVVTDAGGDDAIGIRSMVYLTLSFDHRIVDGAIGGQFLSRIRQYLEQFDFTKVV